MAKLVLLIGNRNFSSWSMRAWLVLRWSGAAFEEHQVWLDEDRDRAERLRYSPTGRVPALHWDGFAVWDSLAIAELVAELHPQAKLWPADARARARARSLCAEMHSGFQALRSEMPVNIRGRKPARDRGPDVARDVARIAEMWQETRREFGKGGPYLFGQRTIADAFYAPVATRFQTYSIALTGEAAAYRDAVLAEPAVREWTAAGEREEHVIEPFASKP